MATQGNRRILESAVVCFEHGEREPMHVHAEQAQLKWPSTGLARVRTTSGVFVVPPTRALWIPAGERHGGIYSGSVTEQNLYIAKEHCAGLPARCAVVVLSPLLKELLVRLNARARSYDQADSAAEDEEALASLRGEMVDSGARPLRVEAPSGTRMQAALETFAERPDDEGTLADWARRLDMSPRTFARLFKREIGSSFGVWRKHARLLRALELLATGADVSRVSVELGYRSDSAFIYMFRRTLGTTPRRYFAEVARGPGC